MNGIETKVNISEHQIVKNLSKIAKLKIFEGPSGVGGVSSKPRRPSLSLQPNATERFPGSAIRVHPCHPWFEGKTRPKPDRFQTEKGGATRKLRRLNFAAAPVSMASSAVFVAKTLSRALVPQSNASERNRTIFQGSFCPPSFCHSPPPRIEQNRTILQKRNDSTTLYQRLTTIASPIVPFLGLGFSPGFGVWYLGFQACSLTI
jgi:hypothetical protein